MKRRKLGPFAVAEIGLGCMNLSHAYGVPPPIAHLVENLHAAVVSLNTEQMARLDSSINQRTVSGARYSPTALAEIDTEDFD